MGVIEAVFDVLGSESTYYNCALFAAFLAFAACGEWVAERAGTLNISVEAMLLSGAFLATLGYHLSGSVAVGVLAGIAGGLAIAAPQAEMSHRLAADQFVVGLTLNIVVFGLAGFLDNEISPQATLAGRLEIPLLSDLPLIGGALFGQRWPFYILFVLVPLAWWLVYKTRWGLELRSAGENPQSADVSGINVNKRRRQAIYFSGLASGLGGAFLVFGHVGSFEETIVGGRGFIAIAAIIFGGWTLRGTLAGCLLFAAALSVRLSVQGLGYEVNNELLQSLPFIVTLAAMAIFANRLNAPGALDQPFHRGLR